MLALAFSIAVARAGPSESTLTLRGREQTVHLYGPAHGDPVIISSGDGGWMHLGPHVAQVLAANGFFVVGFDVKRYLEGFTTERATLRPQDEPDDFRALAEYAQKASGSWKRPILIGVSEGAGLSVLAAADSRVKPAISGVIGLGLPDMNELGWRWMDSLIYLTHSAPREPAFSAAAIAGRISPLPLAVIHATRDEFVPVSEVQRVLQRAREPKRLWIVSASNHRFSNNLGEFDRRLLEAVDWIRQNTPRR